MAKEISLLFPGQGSQFTGMLTQDLISSYKDIIDGMENSLRELNTDYIDIFQLHGVAPKDFDHAITIVPELLKEKEKGKGKSNYELRITFSPSIHHGLKKKSSQFYMYNSQIITEKFLKSVANCSLPTQSNSKPNLWGAPSWIETTTQQEVGILPLKLFLSNLKVQINC